MPAKRPSDLRLVFPHREPLDPVHARGEAYDLRPSPPPNLTPSVTSDNAREAFFSDSSSVAILERAPGRPAREAVQSRRQARSPSAVAPRPATSHRNRLTSSEVEPSHTLTCEVRTRREVGNSSPMGSPRYSASNPRASGPRSRLDAVGVDPTSICPRNRRSREYVHTTHLLPMSKHHTFS